MSPNPFPPIPAPELPRAPRIAVHGAAEVDRALAAADRCGCAGLVLVSPDAASGYAGVAWWNALMKQAAARTAIALCGLLDCGGSAPDALDALRLGLRHLVLRPTHPAQFHNLLARAAPLGALVLTDRPFALSASRHDLERRLADWNGIDPAATLLHSPSAAPGAAPVPEPEP